ncbi:hypothetical protein BKA62DRAFT_186092 [Auriculariales sp. MPI-PUGE-AT-0066]|nr:hypothetical protein BKA62DRAFT_186092 [Auriculariales sp. MPI-PUGE-AT-0066]
MITAGWRPRRLHSVLALILTTTLFYYNLPLPEALSQVRYRKTQCAILPSTDDRFELELCYNTDACNAGTITVAAPLVDCSREQTRLTSANASEHDWTYRNIGPHTFHLQLYGATRAAQEPARFLGPDKCAWRFDFDAKASGRLGLQVHHVYENFAAYMNIHSSPPMTNWTALLETPVGFPAPRDPVTPTHRENIYLPEVDLCPDHTLMNARILGKTRPPSAAQPLLKVWRTPEQNAAREKAPLCSRHHPVPGVYRAAHPSDQRRSLVSYKGYVWEPEPQCRMDELPYHDTESQDVLAQLNQYDRNILFLGDSHNRYAYYFIRSWYQQNWTYLLDPYRLKEEYSSWGRGKTRFEFVWDRFMELALPDQFDCDRVAKEYGKFDTIVLSTGQHLMITNHGETDKYPFEITTVEPYVERVRQTIQTFLTRCPPRPGSQFEKRRIVWMTPPGYRPPYVPFRWDDHRTNTRISQYTARAVDMLRREFPEVAIIDQYTLTLPFVRETLDGLHSYGTDAAYPIALEVNHKLGIGKPRGWWIAPTSGSSEDRNEPQQTFTIGRTRPTDIGSRAAAAST